MFEVVVSGLSYIRGVPVELTGDAIEAGMLRRGCVVGLTVHPPSDPGNKVLVEVRLTDEGQGKRLKPGQVIVLEERHRMLSDNIYCIVSIV